MILSLTTNKAGSFVFKAIAYLGGSAFQSFREGIAGARFDSATKTNVMTDRVAALRAVERLTVSGFSFDAASKPAIESLQGVREVVATAQATALANADAIDAVLRARGLSLFDFQRTGVAWLASRKTALLADDMGLGKTIQVLAALPPGAPVLVICPKVAKGTWTREVKKWRPEIAINVIAKKGTFVPPVAGEMTIVNYDILAEADAEATFAAGTVLVMDEAHMVKSYKAKRSKATKAIARATRAVGGSSWALTATPILNHPGEIHSILDIAGCANEAFGSWNTYVEMFGGYQGRYGMVWGTPDADRVARALQRVMLRRIKTEVLGQFPKKMVSLLTVELDKLASRDAKLVEEVDRALSLASVRDAKTIDEFERALKDEGISFEKISRVRALLATAKIPAMLEMVEQYEEQATPLVVFSAHRAPVLALEGREGWAVITGDTTAEERTAIEARFQRGELRGVAGTIKAAGVAITLTHSADAIMVDREWTPALNHQAEDRIYRIGTTKPVLIVCLVSSHAIDSRVAELLAEKSELIDTTVETARAGALPTSAPTVDPVIAPDAPVAPVRAKVPVISAPIVPIVPVIVEPEAEAAYSTIEIPDEIPF